MPNLKAQLDGDCSKPEWDFQNHILQIQKLQLWKKNDFVVILLCLFVCLMLHIAVFHDSFFWKLRENQSFRLPIFLQSTLIDLVLHC